MNVYLDASAMVKGYIAESGSEGVVELVAGADRAGASWLGLPEVLSAVSRVFRAGLMNETDATSARDRFLADGPNYHWLTVDRDLIDQAGELIWRHGLRAIDAVHLATAQRWTTWMMPDETVFATFDKRLSRAARAEGMSVWPVED